DTPTTAMITAALNSVRRLPRIRVSGLLSSRATRTRVVVSGFRLRTVPIASRPCRRECVVISGTGGQRPLLAVIAGAAAHASVGDNHGVLGL
ncbi:MAG: hypothetical protein Q9169_008262, partial [Polycauliona sp. 2 TL-2023]